MKAGIKGWMDAFYTIETESKLLMDVMDLNQANPRSWVIGKDKIGSLKNACVLDIRSADQFAAGHIDGAINIPYADLWTFKNLEMLNKSRDLVLVSDDDIIAGALALSFRLLDYTVFICK